jgi:hypothetical protein
MTTEDVLKRNNHITKIKDSSSLLENYGTCYIPEYNGIKLTVNNINKIEIHDREIIADFLFNFYRTNGFPYPKYSIKELQDDWNKLIQLDTKKVFLEPNILSVNNLNGNLLFKHFATTFYKTKEDKAKVKDMFESFNDDDNLKKVIRNRLGITFFYRGVSFPFTISGNMIRQGFRSTRLCSTTSTFKASVAKAIYDRFCATGFNMVFDYSMGFGQRLAGGLSKNNIFYIGCDPWKETFDNNVKLVEFLGLQNRCDLINSGSENYYNEKYKDSIDIAFSSPPYFNKEVYSDDLTQCYNNGYDYFINYWWQKTVENMSLMLKKNGKLIINIVDKYKKYNLSKDMIDICNKYNFSLNETLYLKLSKSHLTNKAGTDKLSKLEPIYVLNKN